MRGIVSVVTGAGKTLFAEACLLAFLERYPAGQVLIIVPTLALLDQWYVSIREDLGLEEAAISTYSGEGTPQFPTLLNIAVLNTARGIATGIAKSGQILLIVDEVHRAATSVNRLAIQGPWRATLGMSATPNRDYDCGLETILVPTLGDLVYTYDFRRAAADGVISPFDLINVEIELLSREKDEYSQLSGKIARLWRSVPGGAEANDNLKRLMQRRAAISGSAALRIPTAIKLVERHRGVRTLVFHERVEAAEQILKGLLDRNLSATIFHSHIAPALRRDNLRLFRRGVFDCLVTCRALDEGVNVPETAAAVIASSSASSRQRIQRMGRVLRPSPGKEAASVYTIYATDLERERLVREAETEIGARKVTWMRGRIVTNG